MKMTEIAELIKKARLERNLTQWQLGDLTGTSTSYISYVEAGKSMPSLKQIYKLEMALNLKNGELATIRNRMAFTEARSELMMSGQAI